MKSFSSIEEAFQWWIDTIYKSLPPEQKKGRYTTAWRDFTYDQGISEKRMKEILAEFGDAMVEIKITFIPK